MCWGSEGVYYYVETAASSGSITTEYFGDRFDAAKVETNLDYDILVYPPASVRINPNIPNLTLHLDVEKVSLEDLSSGEDRLAVEWNPMMETHMTFNYTPPTGGRYGNYEIQLIRDVLPADVRKQKLDMMPGYRVTWYYSGMEVEPEARYYNNTRIPYPSTMAFVRHYSNNISR